MTALDDYQPLESLLLFQSLSAYGTDDDSFTKISQSLSNSLLLQHASPERFAPASLQQLYLKLLKEEAKLELQDALDHEDNEANGTGGSSSRKRKAPSPVLPTVEAASHHAHLLPKLIEKLYSRYKEEAVRKIREEERVYDDLVVQLKSEETTEAEANGDEPKTDSKDGSQARKPAIDSRVNQGEKARLDALNTEPSLKVETKTGSAVQDVSGAVATQSLQHLQSDGLPEAASFNTENASQVLNDGTSKVPTGAVGDSNALDLSASKQRSSLQGKEEFDLKNQSAAQMSRREDPAVPPSNAARNSQYAPPNSNAQSTPSTQQQQRRLEPNTAPHSKGGVQLPPFQFTPQAQIAQTQSQHGASTFPTTESGKSSNQSSNPSTLLPGRPPKLSSQQIALANTPNRILAPGVVITPGSSTGWKTDPRFASTPHVERPRARSISPISDGEQSPTTNKPFVASRGAREHLNKTKASRSASLSRASSARSPVKNEPNTPIAALRDDADAVDSPAVANKRKRMDGDAEESMMSATHEPPDRRYIIATRNFSRTTGSLMNNITSHKHASIFANPIKGVEGYNDIIYRSQDLKSIRAMLSAGNKAVAAFSESNVQSSPGSQSSKEVVIPINADLMPPKAIVNADQLEKEILRMFANAVMFNPGDAETVTAAREMFETVEKHVADWRETVLGEDPRRGSLMKRQDLDTDELGEGDEGETSTMSRGPNKRRRL